MKTSFKRFKYYAGVAVAAVVVLSGLVTVSPVSMTPKVSAMASCDGPQAAEIGNDDPSVCEKIPAGCPGNQTFLNQPTGKTANCPYFPSTTPAGKAWTCGWDSQCEMPDGTIVKLGKKTGTNPGGGDGGATGKWIDAQTISYGGQTFLGPTLWSPNIRYNSTSKNDCGGHDFIEFDHNPTATPGEKTPGFYDTQTAVACQPDTDNKITLIDTRNATLTKAQKTCYINGTPDRITSCIQDLAHKFCNDSGQTGSDPSHPISFDQCMKNQIAIISTPIGPDGIDPGPDRNPNPANGAGENPELDCNTTKSDLDWIICPVVKLVNATLTGLDNAIISLLEVDPKIVDENQTDYGARYYKAWQTFRNISLGVLVIAALIMIIGQSLGFEILDAYTLKKVMPRLVIAIIGISLSWQLMKWFVVFTNDLGFGVRQIIYYPFKGLNDGSIIGGGASVIVSLLTVGAILALKIAGLLTLAGTALLGLFIAFMVLVARQLVIVVLILMAPIAIACYVLPNTQNVWKLWHESFSKALLMFPIIMAFLATGRVFAVVSSGPSAGVVGQLVAFVAYILPYFLIPLTFRFAGGALRTIGGFANDKSRGAFDRLKKRRAGIMSKNWQDTKDGKYFNGTGAQRDGSLRNRLNRGLQTGTLLGQAGFNPANMRSNIRAARSTRNSALKDEVEKSAAARTVLGNDDLLTASLHGDGSENAARHYLSTKLGQRGRELDQNVASIMQAKKDVGKDAFEEYAAVNNAGTGTGYSAGPADMLNTINRVAGKDRAKAGRMLAAARSQAERAKRIDLYGAGMATSADQMSQLYNGKTNEESVNATMTDEGLLVKSAGEVASARHGGLKNMVPAMVRRTGKAQAAVNVARDNLQRAKDEGQPQEVIDRHTAQLAIKSHEHKRILAATAAMQDVASSLSEENSQVVGAYLGQTLSGGTVKEKVYGERQATDLEGNPAIDTTKGMPVMERYVVSERERPETLLDQIEASRGDPEFTQYRREYGSSAQAAAMGAGGPPPGIPPPDAGAAAAGAAGPGH